MDYGILVYDLFLETFAVGLERIRMRPVTQLDNGSALNHVGLCCSALTVDLEDLIRAEPMSQKIRSQDFVADTAGEVHPASGPGLEEPWRTSPNPIQQLYGGV